MAARPFSVVICLLFRGFFEKFPGALPFGCIVCFIVGVVFALVVGVESGC